MPWLRPVPTPVAWPPPRDRAGADAALRYARQRDPIGHGVHLFLAMVHVGSLPVATTPESVSMILLVAVALTRLPTTWRCTVTLLRDPVLWLLLAWAGWHGLSILWSATPDQGLDELRAFRAILLCVALWPVINRATLLVIAFASGLLLQHVVQACQLTHLFGLEPNAFGRAGGWMHPVHTGAMCAAAMAWHLVAALRRRGWIRGASLAALAAATAGLLATGSRGPWIAALVTIPVLLIVTSIRERGARRPAIVLALAGLLAAAATWPVVDDFVANRIRQTQEDLRAAEAGNYDSHVGQRLAAWSCATSMLGDAPLRGVGAGGFRQALVGRAHGEVIASFDHAHSLYLQVLATTGLAGGLIVLALLVALVRRAAREPRDSLYAGASLFLLITWLIGAFFDAYHLSGHMLALLILVHVFTMPLRPPADGVPAWLARRVRFLRSA